MELSQEISDTNESLQEILNRAKRKKEMELPQEISYLN